MSHWLIKLAGLGKTADFINLEKIHYYSYEDTVLGRPAQSLCGETKNISETNATSDSDKVTCPDCLEILKHQHELK